MATVRRRSPQEKINKPQWQVNAVEEAKTQQAKSGQTAKEVAAAKQRQIDAKKMFQSPKVIKVNSNPVPGKTVIGPLARGAGQGGIAGLALGAISAYKQELANLARRKREIS